MRRIIWILFLCVTLVGCSKNNSVVPPVEPPVTIIQPKVVLSITPEGVVLPYGSKAVINWSSTDSKLCILNNETVQTTGTKEVQLFVDTKYSIVAVSGILISTPVEKLVKVGDWTTSKLGLLTYDGAPWMTKYQRVFQDGKMVSNSELDQYQKSLTYYYTVEGKMKFTDSSGIEGNEVWCFSSDEKYILMGKDKVPYLIEGLTKNEFIFSIPTDYYSKPAIFQITYYRPGVQ